MMLFKIMILVGVMTYYTQSANANKSAIFWGISVLLLNLMFYGVVVPVFITAAMATVIALIIFRVLNYLEGNSFYWPAYVGAIAGLIIL